MWDDCHICCKSSESIKRTQRDESVAQRLLSMCGAMDLIPGSKALIGDGS